MALPDDGRAIRLHGHPHPGEIDGKEGAPVLAGQHAAGFQRFPAPAIKAEDPVGLGDGVPALQVGQFAAIGFASAQMPVIGLPPQGTDLFC
jgi:hypothetical protein